MQNCFLALLCCWLRLSPACLTLRIASVRGGLQWETQLSALPLPPCRAILVLKDSVVPMSCEFTPETERQRIQHLVSDLCASDDPAVSIPLDQRGGLVARASPALVPTCAKAEPAHPHTFVPSSRLFSSPSSWMVSSRALSFHGGWREMTWARKSCTVTTSWRAGESFLPEDQGVAQGSCTCS